MVLRVKSGRPVCRGVLNISYALDLLIRHPTIFASSLSPPPYVYMISPWSPLLPSDHPDYYPSYFTWIPSPIIATQHITVSYRTLPPYR